MSLQKLVMQISFIHSIPRKSLKDMTLGQEVPVHQKELGVVYTQSSQTQRQQSHFFQGVYEHLSGILSEQEDKEL